MEQNLTVINDLLPILTSGKTGVWSFDPLSEQMEFKNDYFNLLDLTRLKVEFSSLAELKACVHADDVQAFDDAFAEAIAGKNSFVTYRFSNTDGDPIQLETKFMPSDKSVIACTVNKTAMQQMQH